MKGILLFFVFIIILMNFSCKKSGDNSQNDCKQNNYGIYKVTFGSNAIKHSVLVALGYGFREKLISSGVLSDTLHIRPGTYIINIASVHKLGGTIEMKSETPTISQCNESGDSVTF